MIVKWAQLIDGKMLLRRHKITMENEVDNFGFIRSLLGQIGQDPKNYQQPLKRLAELYNNLSPEDLERYHDYFFSSLKDLGFKPVPALAFSQSECFLNPDPNLYNLLWHFKHQDEQWQQEFQDILRSEPGFFDAILNALETNPVYELSKQDLLIRNLASNIAVNLTCSHVNLSLHEKQLSRFNGALQFYRASPSNIYSKIVVNIGNLTTNYSDNAAKTRQVCTLYHLMQNDLLLNECVTFVPNSHKGQFDPEVINSPFLSNKFIISNTLLDPWLETTKIAGTPFTVEEDQNYVSGNPEMMSTEVKIVQRGRVNSYFVVKLRDEIERRMQLGSYSFESDSRHRLMTIRPKIGDILGGSNGYRMPRLDELIRNVERM